MDPCLRNGNVCGENEDGDEIKGAGCKTKNHVYTCFCKPGFFGSYPNCKQKQCSQNGECPSNQQCIR